MIASVIVDLKVQSLDRVFDYLVPKEFEIIIEAGSRVYVPFGNMKRMGFVKELKNESEFENLKEIIDVLDIYPLINQELLYIGDYLHEKMIYPRFMYYQTMLPNFLNVKHEKKVVINGLVDLYIQSLFQNKKELDYNKINSKDLPAIKKEIKNGNLKLIENYKRKETIKKIKYLSKITYKDNLSPLQKKVMAFFDKEEEVLASNINASPAVINALVKKDCLKVVYKEEYRDYQLLKPLADKNITLTDEQNKVVNEVLKSKNKNETFLLHGVTGSGKTEVYLKLIEEVVKDGKDVILLIPEITLTPMMVHRFRSHFHDLVAIFHSGLSDSVRYDEWRRVKKGEAKIAIGARSAIFLPFNNLGLIIIDEEHELSYKQDDAPKYYANDVALARAKYNEIPLLLGSATPLVEDYARAKKGLYTLLELKSRINKMEMPKMTLVDMNEEFKKGIYGNLSEIMINAVNDRLKKKEKVIILLNRRGYANFVMCRACGFVVKCPNCDVSLHYHKDKNKLMCHYCGYETPLVNKCPSCGSTYLRQVGLGTERIVEEIESKFNDAKIIRMDNDTTSAKGSHERLLNEFEKDGDILIGTQMIAKGLDYHDVTLACVVAADLLLKVPDFRSAENTYDLLTQVAGRAGRGKLKGEVIVQSHDVTHYAIKLACENNYSAFYERELKTRFLAKYSPFYFMMQIEIKHKDLKVAFLKALEVKKELDDNIKTEKIILGPTIPDISKINNLYSVFVLMKYKSEVNLKETLNKIYEKLTEENVIFQIDKFPSRIV